LLISSLQQKLDKKTEQVLPRSEVVGGDREGAEGRAGVMAQTMYAHMNKLKKFFKLGLKRSSVST
jgi:hypothetical protein